MKLELELEEGKYQIRIEGEKEIFKAQRGLQSQP
jgi:hypothetical protein